MSCIPPTVLPLSFSVERLLQQTNRSPGSNSIGSVGSTSDNDSTPPSSPDSSCNFTDKQQPCSSLSQSSFRGQFHVLNSSNFTTFPSIPCIPLSTFSWSPAALTSQPVSWRMPCANSNSPVLRPAVPSSATTLLQRQYGTRTASMTCRTKLKCKWYDCHYYNNSIKLMECINCNCITYVHIIQ